MNSSRINGRAYQSRRLQSQSRRQDRMFESSNVRPYVISEHTQFNQQKNYETHFLSKESNLQSKSRKSKSRAEAANSLYLEPPQQLPYYQTKRLHEQDQMTDLGEPLERIPLIKNTLHLELPKKQKMKVKTYVGEQQQYQSQWKAILAKICGCCMKPDLDDLGYEDCDYCDRRVPKGGPHKHGEKHEKKKSKGMSKSKSKKNKSRLNKKRRNSQQSESSDSSSSSDSSDSSSVDEEEITPYISDRRIKIRETQPVNTFFQDITNEKIINDRHETHIEY